MDPRRLVQDSRPLDPGSKTRRTPTEGWGPLPLLASSPGPNGISTVTESARDPVGHPFRVGGRVHPCRSEGPVSVHGVLWVDGRLGPLRRRKTGVREHRRNPETKSLRLCKQVASVNHLVGSVPKKGLCPRGGHSLHQSKSDTESTDVSTGPFQHGDPDNT